MKGLREGLTTGTCAAAAVMAAAMVLRGDSQPESVEIELPDSERVSVPVLYARVCDEGIGEAAVKKDAGDDPDTTNGATIVATVKWAETGGIAFHAGEGVGVVTKPGLSVAVGEPAINPVPRRMIAQALREVDDRPASVTISIPGGRELAARTFNPRLGVEGGLSILGTSGRVRPYSSSALRDALKCSLDVAAACGIDAPVFVPGRIGERAARANFDLGPEQVVEVVNEWGFMLDAASGYDFRQLLAVGHPGKLAKLIEGHWDTHSSRSPSALPVVSGIAGEMFSETPDEQTTVEGVFASLDEEKKPVLACELAERVRCAITEKLEGRLDVAVALSDMAGGLLGCAGNVEAWR